MLRYSSTTLVLRLSSCLCGVVPGFAIRWVTLPFCAWFCGFSVRCVVLRFGSWFCGSVRGFLVGCVVFWFGAWFCGSVCGFVVLCLVLRFGARFCGSVRDFAVRLVVLRLGAWLCRWVRSFFGFPACHRVPPFWPSFFPLSLWLQVSTVSGAANPGVWSHFSWFHPSIPSHLFWVHPFHLLQYTPAIHQPLYCNHNIISSHLCCKDNNYIISPANLVNSTTAVIISETSPQPPQQ